MKRLSVLFVLMFASFAYAADPTHVGSNGALNASATSLTLSDVGGVATNDMEIVQCGSPYDVADIWTDPTDFTQIDQVEGNTGHEVSQYIGYRIRGGSPQALTFSHSQAAAEISCSHTVWRGIDTGTQPDVVYAVGSHFVRGGADVLNPTPAAITTVTADATVLLMANVTEGISTSTDCPSGYTERHDNVAVGGTGFGSYTCSKATDTAGVETPGAYTHVDNGTGSDPESQMFTIAIRPSSGVTFSVSPTVQSKTATTYVMTYTVSGSTTVYFVACNPGSNVPSSAEVEAATCGTPDSSEASANEAVSGADTTTISSISFPRHDIYGIPESGGAVVTLSDQNRTADSGQEFVVLASVSATSVCDDDTYFDPDVAAADVMEVDSSTNEGSFAITWETDCDFSYSDGTGSRQSIDYCVQDVSDATGDFTTPACWSADDIIWVNNTAPSCQTDVDPIVLTEDVAMSTIDLDDFCSDADSDQPTYTVTGGTLPVGTALGGVGSSEMTGTPTTEDEAGVAITFTATDVAADTDTLAVTFYVINTVTLPTLDDSTEAAAISDFQTAFPWQVDTLTLTASFTCTSIEAADQVLSQDPAASTEITAFQAVSMVVSLGPCDFKSATKKAVINGVSIN